MTALETPYVCVRVAPLSEIALLRGLSSRQSGQTECGHGEQDCEPINVSDVFDNYPASYYSVRTTGRGLKSIALTNNEDALPE